jgi:hypothetical protein
VAQAVEFASGVRSANIKLFEQPTPAGDWEALADLRRRTGLRIAFDESVTRVSDVANVKAHDAADAVNAKIMKSGVFEASGSSGAPEWADRAFVSADELPAFEQRAQAGLQRFRDVFDELWLDVGPLAKIGRHRA